MSTGSLEQAIECNSIVFPDGGGAFVFKGVGSVNFTPDGFPSVQVSSGGTLNFADDVVFTHSSNTLTMTGGDLVVPNLYVGSTGKLDFGTGDVTVTHSANMLTVAGGDLTTPNLYIGATGKIDLGAGDVTATHSANTLTFAGASSGYVFDALVTTSGNLTKTAGYSTAVSIRAVTGTFAGENDTSITGSTQIPANSYVIGVLYKCKTVFQGTAAAGLKLGYVGDDDIWGTGIALAANTETAPTSWTKDAFDRAANGNYFAAATDILLASCDAGTIDDATPTGLAYYVIYYLDLAVPSVA